MGEEDDREGMEDVEEREVVERERSQSLMVRSNDPETMYFCSRLRGDGRRARVSGARRRLSGRGDAPLGETAHVVAVRADRDGVAGRRGGGGA